MVVDDTPDNLRLFSDLLVAEGYKVRPTPDAQLAIKSAFANPPDLILLDVKMPVINGFDVCKRLKQDERTENIPVIFISALQDTEDRVKGFECGGVDFITKPVQREEVIARVSSQLELFRARSLLEQKNQELSKANLKLQGLDKLKSLFIANMSHELRTPLNAIIGFAGVMLQEIPGKVNEKQNNYLNRVTSAGKHLLGLINDVIDISKIESGHLDVNPQRFCLKQLVDEAIEIIKPQANKKQLSIEVDATAWPEINTDYKRLFQCLLNYLSNAINFTDQGTITIIVREENNNLKIGVQDTGKGIPEAGIPNLFQAFDRLQAFRNEESEGSGLGLYLTRTIVTGILKGSVAVESQINKGSTFYIQIPKDLKIDTHIIEKVI